MSKADDKFKAEVAELQAADATRREKVEAAFKERYGDARWQERIEKSPNTESQLISLIETEMDIDMLRTTLAEMIDRGEETFIAQMPNGVVGRHPLRAELQALEGVRKNLCVALKLNLGVKDNIKSQKSAVSQIAGATR